MKAFRIAAAALVLALVLPLAACAPSAPRLSLRLWDTAVADAYRTSLAEFTRQTGRPVDVVVVPWADYWTQLRADVATGTVDDVFWVNATSFEQYAEAGRIRPITAPASSGWSEAVVAQYTRDGQLWGVPQITDPGIGLVYNADLLAQAGLTPADVAALRWDPAAADDSLRQAARRLTLDADGRHPGDPGFDPARVRQYGFGAANDLNAVLLQFLAGNGAAWQDGDRFSFDSPEGVEAVQYLVDLIETGIAPSAADTNPPAGGDFVKDQFLRGNVALFPTGAYSLPAIEESANFRWGIARLPSGPAGSLSVTNGIVAAASSTSDDPEGQQELLRWLGSAAGQEPIAEAGAALPAHENAQAAYLETWRSRGVDLSPMLDVLNAGVVQGPRGARYPAAEAAMQQTLNSVFEGRLGVADGLTQAARAGNAAMESEPAPGATEGAT